jgi:hypothetical protein
MVQGNFSTIMKIQQKLVMPTTGWPHKIHSEKPAVSPKKTLRKT